MDTNVPNFLEEPVEEVQEETIFEETDFGKKNSDNMFMKNEDASLLVNNDEERRKYIRSIAPEFKADAIYKRMVKEGRAPISGQPKRRLLRALEREAKKGRLDKYFL